MNREYMQKLALEGLGDTLRSLGSTVTQAADNLGQGMHAAGTDIMADIDTYLQSGSPQAQGLRENQQALAEQQFAHQIYNNKVPAGGLEAATKLRNSLGDTAAIRGTADLLSAPGAIGSSVGSFLGQVGSDTINDAYNMVQQSSPVQGLAHTFRNVGDFARENMPKAAPTPSITPPQRGNTHNAGHLGQEITRNAVRSLKSFLNKAD
jgi:hypothetical protein